MINLLLFWLTMQEAGGVSAVQMAIRTHLISAITSSPGKDPITKQATPPLCSMPVNKEALDQAQAEFQKYFAASWKSWKVAERTLRMDKLFDKRIRPFLLRVALEYNRSQAAGGDNDDTGQEDEEEEEEEEVEEEEEEEEEEQRQYFDEMEDESDHN
jgi:hypothetical protein